MIRSVEVEGGGASSGKSGSAGGQLRQFRRRARYGKRPQPSISADRISPVLRGRPQALRKYHIRPPEFPPVIPPLARHGLVLTIACV